MSSSDDNHHHHHLMMDATTATTVTTTATTATTNPNAWIIDLMAGWCSGAVAIICCQPLDTLLTRYQAERSLTTKVSFTSIQKTSNWMQLWRGSIPMMSAVPFQNALLMAGYGIGKRWGEQHQQQQQQQQQQQNAKEIHSSYYLSTSSKYIPIFIGGCTGGILQSFLMSPVEWIKIQRQVHWVAQTIPTTAAATTTSSSSSYHHLSTLFQHPTRGLGATMLRDGIPHGVWFVAYDWAKTNWTTYDNDIHNDGKKNNIYSEMIVPLGAGAFAATIAWAVGYPFDLIKTRIQANILSNSHKGIWETAIELYQESGGGHGLYRGFGLKLIRSIPASMIGFLVYEQVASLYG